MLHDWMVKSMPLRVVSAAVVTYAFFILFAFDFWRDVKTVFVAFVAFVLIISNEFRNE